MHRLARPAAPILVAALLAACSIPADATRSSHPSVTAGGRHVTMYRNPDCSCCHQWAAIAKAAGWTVATVDVPDMAAFKAEAGVPLDAASCHTTLVGDYFVEGHVPLAAIDRLLAERPSIDGIALAGMPAGSPGMGGVQDGPLNVVAVADGQITPFATY